MASLTMEDALALAGSLVTIGHPFSQVALNATALDLIKLCKGKALAPGRMLSPQKQAEQLIDRVRAWEDGWPERGGTRKMQLLFQELYGTKEEWVPISYEQTLERGLIRPPCPHCDDSGYVGTRPHIAFCDCKYGRHQKDWEGERGLQRINAEPAKRDPARAQTLRPFTPITEADMKKALEDERARKAEQLRKLGLD